MDMEKNHREMLISLCWYSSQTRVKVPSPSVYSRSIFSRNIDVAVSAALYSGKNARMHAVLEVNYE